MSDDKGMTRDEVKRAPVTWRPPPKQPKLNNDLARRWAATGLPTRAANVIAAQGIETIEQLAAVPMDGPNGMRNWPNAGMVSRAQIRRLLAENSMTQVVAFPPLNERETKWVEILRAKGWTVEPPGGRQ